MATFRFQRHGRIQEAVAEELGFFRDLGLVYEIAPHRPHARGVVPGYERLTSQRYLGEPSAYRDFVLGSSVSNVASTSYWAVSIAVATNYGELWPSAYSFMPAGIYVGPKATIRSIDELAGRELVVGRHSGSHFAALYALRRTKARGPVELNFVEGRIRRLDYLLEHSDALGSMYGADAYILETHGYRKILDTSFIVAFMIAGAPGREDVDRYFEALRLAQRAIDEDPGRFSHLLLLDYPTEIKASQDIRPFGIGERLVFEDYPTRTLATAREWIRAEKLLPEDWQE